MSGMKIMFTALILIACSPLAHAGEFSGEAIYIVDGDTFDIQTTAARIRIRFCGIDSPERRHAGYRESKDALANLIRGKIVRCVQVSSGTPCDGRSKPTNRNRVVAQCFLDDVDIAAEMVRNGNACDWPKFSGGHYRLDDSTCVHP